MDHIAKSSQPKKNVYDEAVESGKEKYASIGNKHLDPAQKKEYEEIFKLYFQTKPDMSSLVEEKYPYIQADSKVIGLTKDDEIWEFDTKVKGAKSGGHYHNKINPLKGELLAIYNVRDDKENEKDPQTEKYPYRLPGSEIQYQQLLLATAMCNEYNKRVEKVKLARITRMGIINEVSRTIFQTIVDVYGGSPPIFHKHQNEFFAILATPNGLSSLFLLKDHGVDLGIQDIDHIQLFTETDEGKKLKVTFSIFFKLV